MGKIIFLNIIAILSFLLTDIASVSSDRSKNKIDQHVEMEVLSQSSPESAILNPYVASCQMALKAGLKNSSNRRTIWIKNFSSKNIHRNITILFKTFTSLISQTSYRKSYIKILASRYTDGFYIYSLKKLIV